VIEATSETHRRPELPGPKLTRWQPLRLGLVELFRYDSEEFWFRDGHLLLRGNNGTGKSKVLALTLPFLFDARLTPSRLEPDGDPGKKMAWNLLLGNYERRTGYAWIEFARLRADGSPQFLTLGAGLSAVAARANVESWYFTAEGPRIGEDLWLTTAQRGVVPRERLRDALAGVGQLFDNAKDYRRAVDERLFHLGTTRYEALMDTLVQLRQPQLSKRPDETNLSNALTESLPPLATDMLGDVAEALNRLEDDRRQLEEYGNLERAVARFEQRYRLYAGTQSRRQARRLRQAQTDFDNASRSFNEAQGRLATAHVDELRAMAARDAAALQLADHQSRLETLRSDPTMQDANRLEQAQRDAAARRTALDAAHAALAQADARLARATTETLEYSARLTRAERDLERLRRDAAARGTAAGVETRYAANPLSALESAAAADLVPRAFDDAAADFVTMVSERREQIALVRRRIAALAQAELVHAQRRESLDVARDDADGAAGRRDAADKSVESAGDALVSAWRDHFSALVELHVTPNDSLAELAEWVLTPVADNPARLTLQVAQQEAAVRFGDRRAELAGQRRIVEDEDRTLAEEQSRLEAGEDTTPPVPYTRDAAARDVARAGAPLWQLVEFRADVATEGRAGLEAALEAAGLLDAWVAPDGRVDAANGETLFGDTSLLQRPQLQSSSLADWLRPAAREDRIRAGIPAHASVDPEVVERVLAGVACDDDPESSEAWVAPDGRFRLGPLAGAWLKPAAVYIGFAARAAARVRRLAAIAERRSELDAQRVDLEAQRTLQAQAELAAQDEWRRAPADDPLLTAHLTARACAREFVVARDRLAQAQARFVEIDLTVQTVRRELLDAATDLHLPETVDALSAVEAELERFSRTLQMLVQAAGDVRAIWPELLERRSRAAEARADRATREEQLGSTQREAHEAAARWEVLRDAVGASVRELQARIVQAAEAVMLGKRAVEHALSDVRTTGEARAVAAVEAANAERALQQSSEGRAAAVRDLQAFAATGLLAVALADSGASDLPDLRIAWTIDPALSLARRTEQILTGVDDGDDAWKRVQQRVNEEFTELHRALSALGQQVQGETSDYGFVVHIVYQNRPESPGELAKKLAAEIAQRRELLSATEREVLENHLQAEIATEVQRLLVAAEKQVESINAELHKRPTSTGVRYRLQWLPLAEGADGAPVGLEAARKRLLNTSSDLWSAEDRRVVGALLQQRIAAERERADTAGSSSLTDQLARALDYRRWHVFRVQRWQDGQWRKLSGPASSGERALGLTVPLFAAVASFYSQSGYSDAPRLVLLDEAFAGIDAPARAHCMALIREFDLDFVITSENEWACYAELPGVSICHLQRREGVDAVLVSRWTWDGRARRPQDDPNRRFAPV
jgi:uncharacterized protein (TIGR02680 family)